MSEKESKTVDDGEEEEDLEKLQAEIARMEAEAARIAQETEDLEKQSSSKAAAAASSTSAGSTATKAMTAEEKNKRDGWVNYSFFDKYVAAPAIPNWQHPINKQQAFHIRWPGGIFHHSRGAAISLRILWDRRAGNNSLR